MKAILRAVRKAVVAKLQPYDLDVQWDGAFYRHSAWTSAEALEWARMYPANARCEVWTRGLYRGPVIVAVRG
jgi:hypothetical protein